MRVENTQVDQDAAWALCKRSVSDLRREPKSISERTSQILLGEAARIIGVEGEWSYVRLERDGYHGWVHSAALERCSREAVAAYLANCHARVAAGLLPARLSADSHSPTAGLLPFGVRLPVEERTTTAARVRLPDGRTWWVDRDGLLEAALWPTPTPAGIAFTLELVRRFVGTPYLWGGRTPWGFDCSGFAVAFWAFLGIELPRDADQQFQAGKVVEGKASPGDLIFFGSLPEEIRDERQQDRFASISHVAIALGGDDMIHANGAAWGVSYNSLDPASPRYRSWLREHFAGTRRLP